MKSITKFITTLLLSTLLSPTFLFGHSDSSLAGAGILEGFVHPISGLDHVVAMIAVGMWGAILRSPAMWILPVAFPIAMAFGGVLGIVGVPLPFTEEVIALSGIVLGFFVATHRQLPLWLACAVVGVFAIFHGHAHGVEAPKTASPIGYVVGFVCGTGFMHLSGIALGFLDDRNLGGIPIGKLMITSCGIGIMATGMYYLVR